MAWLLACLLDRPYPDVRATAPAFLPERPRNPPAGDRQSPAPGETSHVRQGLQIFRQGARPTDRQPACCRVGDSISTSWRMVWTICSCVPGNNSTALRFRFGSRVHFSRLSWACNPSFNGVPYSIIFALSSFAFHVTRNGMTDIAQPVTEAPVRPRSRWILTTFSASATPFSLLADRPRARPQRRQSIVAIKNVTINEPFFAGHFPGLR